MSFQLPSHDCPLCPRLAAFRDDNRKKYPDFFNGPVPPFGNLDAELLIVGLAPGLKGANRTGRPFTGDYAGDILYASLAKYGFAKGTYKQCIDDRFELVNCRVTNAVRCVPPENKPETAEIKTCNQFLVNEIAAMPKLKAILSLGGISHAAVLRALKLKAGAAKFTHGMHHNLKDGLILVDTYHTSRYNINTGLLTQGMFDKVIEEIQSII